MHSRRVLGSMILCKISGSDSKFRGCIRLSERDRAVVAVDEAFSYFMFEGASKLPVFSFLDNKERIAKILGKRLQRDCKDSLSQKWSCTLPIEAEWSTFPQVT